MHTFFDTSAFTKRYVFEQGSDTVLQLCNNASEISLAGIAIPEIISAFCRLLRENKITPVQYQQLKSALFSDIEDIAVCDSSPQVISHAIHSLETNVLRGMDAIHIGCAVVVKADIFISADARQCEAAIKMGLTVEQV